MQTEPTLLLFDDQYREQVDNLDRRLRQPAPAPEGICLAPDPDSPRRYPSVFAAPEASPAA